jgi:cell division septal protein FtsQ
MVDKNYKKMLSKRRRRNAKRKFFLFLKILAIMVVFAGLLWGFNYLYNSSYFMIKDIQVNDNSYYDDKEIMNFADVAIGINIFEVDKKVIEDRLKKQLVWLKSVTLSKVFPDKIEISVTERKPFVLAAYGGKNYLIDEEGIVLDVFDMSGPSGYKDLILIKNAIEYRPDIGEKIAKKSILSCGEIYGSIDLEIKKDIKEAYISDSFSGDIIFVTNNDKKIIFGNSDKIIDKNAVLRKIIAQLNENEVSFSSIDIRNVDNPVIE